MLKTLKYVLLTVLIIIVAGVIGGYWYAGQIITKAVNTYLPQVTNTPSHLNNVDVSLFKGHISISGLSVGNPAGYGATDAFGLKNITVSFEPKSILSDKIIINQILIDGTQVSAEATYKDGKVSSNLTDIQKNVNQYMSKMISNSSKKEQKQEKTATETPSTTEKQVIIRDLQINNSQLTVGLMKQTITVPLPNIRQKNIGEKGQKMELKDVIGYVFNLINNAAVKNTATTVQKALKDGALKLIGTATDTTNMIKDSAKSIVDNATQDAKGIGNAVKGIFGK
ncbi:MAG: hypothetical protein IJ440_02045 [Alphaproteobacteria bacterium]|nr:hypothetical protein [Alphaproteobacteria bacterium]